LFSQWFIEEMMSQKEARAAETDNFDLQSSSPIGYVRGIEPFFTTN
jgi:hypothetical protein